MKMSTRWESLCPPWGANDLLRCPISYLPDVSLFVCGSVSMSLCSEEVTLELVKILAPLLPGCVTLGKSLNPSEPRLSSSGKWGYRVVDCYKMSAQFNTYLLSPEALN